MWAVVTGASDGIGASYCELLSAQGFNIALVSRTMYKLQAVENKCKSINPAIQTRKVQADFSNVTRSKEIEVLEFYKGIYNKLSDLDIAIVINNAGVMFTGKFCDTPSGSARWKDMIDINIM